MFGKVMSTGCGVMGAMDLIRVGLKSMQKRTKEFKTN